MLPCCSACGHENALVESTCAGCGVSLDPADETVSSEPPDAPELERRVLELMVAGRKIEAINVYREETGCGLREAKNAVEAMGERGGAPKAQGCAALLALAASLGALGALVVATIRGGL